MREITEGFPARVSQDKVLSGGMVPGILVPKTVRTKGEGLGALTLPFQLTALSLTRPVGLQPGVRPPKDTESDWGGPARSAVEIHN